MGLWSIFANHRTRTLISHGSTRAKKDVLHEWFSSLLTPWIVHSLGHWVSWLLPWCEHLAHLRFIQQLTFIFLIMRTSISNIYWETQIICVNVCLWCGDLRGVNLPLSKHDMNVLRHIIKCIQDIKYGRGGELRGWNSNGEDFWNVLIQQNLNI